MLSQYYLAERFLFDGDDTLFALCWHHVQHAYIVHHSLPVNQVALHTAISDIADRIKRGAL
jgi:hypothetical protein